MRTESESESKRGKGKKNENYFECAVFFSCNIYFVGLQLLSAFRRLTIKLANLKNGLIKDEKHYQIIWTNIRRGGVSYKLQIHTFLECMKMNQRKTKKKRFCWNIEHAPTWTNCLFIFFLFFSFCFYSEWEGALWYKAKGISTYSHSI